MINEKCIRYPFILIQFLHFFLFLLGKKLRKFDQRDRKFQVPELQICEILTEILTPFAMVRSDYEEQDRHSETGFGHCVVKCAHHHVIL